MYKIELAKSAEKIIESLHQADRKLYSRLINAIESLAEDPFQGKQLKGPFKGDYSLRVGIYRIIYTVYQRKLVVFIIDAGHRKDIYRNN